MTKTLFEIEISYGINRPPVTFTRLAKSEDDLKLWFGGQKISRITPIKTIKIGKVDLKA
jgi:hypothetical protein